MQIEEGSRGSDPHVEVFLASDPANFIYTR